jgi:hypothetical protein
MGYMGRGILRAAGGSVKANEGITIFDGNPINDFSQVLRAF